MSGGIEQRVWMHWKSMKSACTREFVTDLHCTEPNDECPDPDFFLFSPHRHGHYELRFPNSGWLRLARVHKMPVRQVKDIINKRRGK
jgi:hypothetical protein